MSVPALRFKDDDGQYFPEWEETTLENCASFFRGGSLSKSDIDINGKFSCVHYGELFTTYNEIITTVKSKTNITNTFNSEFGDILMPSSDVTPAGLAKASCILKAGVVLGGDINVIRVKNTIEPKFISYLLNFEKYKIIQLVSGTTVKHIYIKDIKSIKLSIPTAIAEQTKIANFLTAVDEKITQFTQKHDLLTQYKKGVMQRIFSQELRFKDDDGQDFPEWNERKLGEISSFFSGGTPLTTNKDFYNGDIAFIKSGEISSIKTAQFVTEAGLKGSSAKLVSSGDLLYALYGATSGEVAISKINGAINQAVLCIRSNLNTYFLFSYLRFNKNSILETYLQGGQGNLSAEIIKSLDVPCPSEKEQAKIANFFTTIDAKITHTHTQLKSVKQYKQGLLQQMFV